MIPIRRAPFTELVPRKEFRGAVADPAASWLSASIVLCCARGGVSGRPLSGLVLRVGVCILGRGSPFA
jgi:hypothetical protein